MIFFTHLQGHVRDVHHQQTRKHPTGLIHVEIRRDAVGVLSGAKPVFQRAQSPRQTTKLVAIQPERAAARFKAHRRNPTCHQKVQRQPRLDQV